MKRYHKLWRGLLWIVTALLLLNCGGGGSVTSDSAPDSTITSDDEFSSTEYKGLVFYYKSMPPSEYKLAQLSDETFDAMEESQQLAIANKLLNSLFYGYPLRELQEKIAAGNFLSSIQDGLKNTRINKGVLESYILNDAVFRQFDSAWYEPQAITILTRFYAMQELDQYFLQNWIAYILTQTILFSPAYELTSTHTPDISGVYNRLVTMLENGSGMRFITYVHMSSEENWRRFRSPEDNGREMLEIYLQDTDDTHVPLAAKALQNWKLNTDSDTLEVGLNRNTTPIDLFGTTIYTGDDFYRELAKSDAFAVGVTHRLVDFFFPEKTIQERDHISSSIIASHPETWQDILLQILFSEAYLLDNSRPQSAEETFFSLAKKMEFRNYRNTFYYFKLALDDMHQATMKYKLGKLERVPLDTLSFAYYHHYIREHVLLAHANSEQTDPDSWDYPGWQDSFIAPDRLESDSTDDVKSLEAFVDYLFESVIARKADSQEQRMFKTHMIESRDGKELFKYEFNMFATYDDAERQESSRERNRYNIATIVLDYLSRLAETYRQSEVH